jgi:uncharacterized membrane protein YdjX (TVP38/TMEM64 family)
MTAPSPRSRRGLLLKLAAAVVALAVVGLLLLRGYDVKALFGRTLDYVRSAGPAVFFLAQALLPALGVPQTAFSLTAGSLFGERLGMGAVVLCSTLALVANMALTYWLASRLLRPVLERLLTRLGYRLPEVEAGDVTDVIVLLRVTPGAPFPVQNYLLGLGRVPFGRYLLVSTVIAAPLNTAFLLFGEALIHGRGRVAMFTLLGILALLAATHLVRKHYGKKTPAP